jgi:hypothetical protein
MIKHQLIDKYFNNYTNFNSNNSNFESMPKLKINDGIDCLYRKSNKIIRLYG